MSPRLQELFFRSAKKHSVQTALETLSGETISYGDLETLVKEKAALLSSNGIGKGSRVAVMAPKTIPTIAAFLAILETGAAYIPIDIETPAERLQQILRNLDPHAFIAYAKNFPSDIPCQQQMMSTGTGDGLSVTFLTAEDHSEDLAYILYTSGSTGPPKGVCITHENARAFTDWCLSTFSLNEKDRFSSIAPFHFDLSVFDLYVAFGCGGTIVLVDDATIKNARLLAQLIAEKKITVIYATPSLLSLLLNYGKIEKHDFSQLRITLFAGEVFPVQQLHKLMESWHTTMFFNLYGPTETNVCTWHQIPRRVDETRTEPYPIGKICPQLEGRISSEGELLIAGPNVTTGYWLRPDLNEKVFVEYEGTLFYKTGDRVVINKNEELVYSGRIDRMIKKRGYRIEPEEVENVLLRHPDVLEAAVIAGKDAEDFSLLRAFVALRPKAEVSATDIRQFCLEHLPSYMVPEQIHFLTTLPKTSSGKIDLQQLEIGN
ncbi:MAG: amino acid adenylation domain-containing protein [Bacteroidota bacterium]|nr:amino acid adenylation domain-containing protein [Bacteroidota bacterium]